MHAEVFRVSTWSFATFIGWEAGFEEMQGLEASKLWKTSGRLNFSVEFTLSRCILWDELKKQEDMGRTPGLCGWGIHSRGFSDFIPYWYYFHQSNMDHTFTFIVDILESTSVIEFQPDKAAESRELVSMDYQDWSPLLTGLALDHFLEAIRFWIAFEKQVLQEVSQTKYALERLDKAFSGASTKNQE